MEEGREGILQTHPMVTMLHLQKYSMVIECCHPKTVQVLLEESTLKQSKKRLKKQNKKTAAANT